MIIFQISTSILIFLLKVSLSVFIGYYLGRERKRRGKDTGGARTMAIISLASCLMAILSLELTRVGFNFDFVRILSYGIASIGFLGSGMILKSEGKIEGITSAGTIWAIVPINFCIGLGYYFYGIISAILIYLILDSKYWRKNDRS